tara:strand:+ start:384 stop:788 length:405 start_codon:yes stop_codon:yes gene_type:complete
MINLFVQTKPRPQQRHRSNGRFQYDPSSKEKKKFIDMVKDRIPKKPTKDNIDMTFTFCYKRPQTHYRSKNKQKILKDDIPYYKPSVPDIDNLCKFYMDAMQGHFFKSDSQVVSIKAIKVYGTEDFIHIKISNTK